MTTSEIVATATALMKRVANHDGIEGILLNEDESVEILTDLKDTTQTSMMVSTPAGYVPIFVRIRQIKDPDPWEPVA